MNQKELTYEVWKDREECTTLCLAGVCGQEARETLEPYSKLIYTFCANTHFDAMTKYYSFMDFGEYKTDFEEDREPYDIVELVQRAKEIKNKTLSIMNKYIKEYQQQLSKNGYDKNSPILEEFYNYLQDSLSFKKGSIDLVCMYASVQLEFNHFSEGEAARYLEKFAKEYEHILREDDNVRLYTNIASFYSESSSSKKDRDEKVGYYLKLAEQYNSKYAETYYALSMYYCSVKKDLKIAQQHIEKALSIKNDAVYKMAYAEILFENKNYKKVKDILNIALSYMQKNNLKDYGYTHQEEIQYLNIASDIKLGNIKKATNDLQAFEKQNRDEISDWDLSHLYYMLEDYNRIEQFFDENMDLNDDLSIWDSHFEYFYILKLNNRIADFEKYALNIRNAYKEELEEGRLDNEFIIEGLHNFEETIKKIQEENYRPETHIVYYSDAPFCYLIDCIVHKSCKE